MKTIHKKIWPEYFELILSGKKQYELRLADFDISEGDLLVLEEWDPKTQSYTGRTIKKQASYILKFKLDSFGQKKLIEKNGLYVIQFKNYDQKN